MPKFLTQAWSVPACPGKVGVGETAIMCATDRHGDPDLRVHVGLDIAAIAKSWPHIALSILLDIYMFL